MHRAEPARIMTHFHKVDVKPIRVTSRVKAALFVKWKKTKAKSAGMLFSGNLSKYFKVHKVHISAPKKNLVRSYKFNLKSRANAKNAVGRANRTPITRRNRISFLKTLPKFERASLLALYSPIFQEKVKKSALDKSSGNLLFWYDNERVKIGERYHLLLLRVFDGEEPLKWLWVPAGKKLSGDLTLDRSARAQYKEKSKGATKN
jgi:hypothetical protein